MNNSVEEIKLSIIEDIQTGPEIMSNTTDIDLFQTIQYVSKRDGSKEEVDLGKCQNRIKNLAKMEPKLKHINIIALTKQVIMNIYDGIETKELDELAARICAEKNTVHPDYGTLATRIIISNHHKNTSPSFSEVVQTLWDNYDSVGNHNPIIGKYFYELVMLNKAKLNAQNVIDYSKDYNYTYFGFKTLERAYLLKKEGKVVERPQHMLMRVSLAMYRDDIREAIKVYRHLAEGNLTPASPTLYNFGTKREQGSSCFLLTIKEDSIDGIYNTLLKCAHISKYAGGIGIAITGVRAKGSSIRGTNGKSDGILPMLKVYNETARYVNQSGKRKGSFAVYIEPWHADIEEFVVAKRNIGAETERARDLFYAIWAPDLFMERIQKDEDWTLMCPDECPGLIDAYGEDFNKLYRKYEEEGRGRKVIKARQLWHMIITTQIEVGTPYVCFKDAVNLKNNQKNLGTIHCSNLCSEIVEYSDSKQVATCNLTSIALPKCVEYPTITEKVIVYSKSNCNYCRYSKNLLDIRKIEYQEISLDDKGKRDKFFNELNNELMDDDPDADLITSVPQIYFGEKRIGGFIELENVLKPTFNFEKLQEITRVGTRNLNKVIDYNFYPIEESKYSNFLHRPIGIGCQGLADVFAMMRMPFDSPEARVLNKRIAYHMYYAALDASMDLARKRKKHLVDYRRLLKDLHKLENNQNQTSNDEENTITEEEDTTTDTIKPDTDNNNNNQKAMMTPKKKKTPKKKLNLGNSKETKEDKIVSIKSQLEHLKTIYNIIEEELDLPAQYAGAYSSFVGSYTYEGKLQYDLWNANPLKELEEDFIKLKDSIKKHGLRNSLLMAYMPTAGTSQILNNNECIEPYTSNIYKRGTLAGEFKIINQHLITDLIIRELWNEDMKQHIIQNRGSIQDIEEIPPLIKDLYKEVYEMSQKAIINMAADRGEATCQTQSMNIFIADATFKNVNAMLFYGWKSGLKTGMYYLRSREKAHAQSVSIDANKIVENQTKRTTYEDEVCESCSA
jgi:ribonucleoside-diphosphate reductase alpha subunit